MIKIPQYHPLYSDCHTVRGQNCYVTYLSCGSGCYEQHGEQAQLFLNVPIHVFIQLVFKRQKQAEVKHSIKVSVKKITPIHTEMQLIRFLLSKHCNRMHESKHSEVQGNTQQFANALLIENLFCTNAPSNLSSEVCLHPVKHTSKPGSEDHNLDPFPFSCCAVSTKLQ